MVSKEALVVGALLYDIGAFFRASGSRAGHAADGEWFVSEYLSRFRCTQPILEDIRRLVARRHTSELGDSLLLEADRLAGANRQEAGSPDTRSLTSVLTAVNIGKGRPPQDIYR